MQRKEYECEIYVILVKFYELCESLTLKIMKSCWYYKSTIQTKFTKQITHKFNWQYWGKFTEHCSMFSEKSLFYQPWHKFPRLKTMSTNTFLAIWYYFHWSNSACSIKKIFNGIFMASCRTKMITKNKTWSGFTINSLCKNKTLY